jgi:hypothetical protein
VEILRPATLAAVFEMVMAPDADPDEIQGTLLIDVLGLNPLGVIPLPVAYFWVILGAPAALAVPRTAKPPGSKGSGHRPAGVFLES